MGSVNWYRVLLANEYNINLHDFRDRFLAIDNHQLFKVRLDSGELINLFSWSSSLKELWTDLRGWSVIKESVFKQNFTNFTFGASFPQNFPLSVFRKPFWNFPYENFSRESRQRGKHRSWCILHLPENKSCRKRNCKRNAILECPFLFQVLVCRWSYKNNSILIGKKTFFGSSCHERGTKKKLWDPNTRRIWTSSIFNLFHG